MWGDSAFLRCWVHKETTLPFVASRELSGTSNPPSHTVRLFSKSKVKHTNLPAMAVVQLLNNRFKRAVWFIFVLGLFYAVSAQKEELTSPSPEMSLQEIDDKLQVSKSIEIVAEIYK